jgi:hypothetical protein
MKDERKLAPAPSGDTMRDRIVALSKGAVGMVPIAGPMLAELITTVIPNQRIERLEAYAGLLGEQLAAIGREQLKERIDAPDNVDLFEDGARQAVRALSDDRKAYIARLVATGISGNETTRLQSKRLLALLGEVDDDQIVVLTSYLHRHHGDEAFYQKHSAVLHPVVAAIGASQEQLDKSTVHQLARQQLVRLGLLRQHFRKPTRAASRVRRDDRHDEGFRPRDDAAWPDAATGDRARQARRVLSGQAAPDCAKRRVALVARRPKVTHGSPPVAPSSSSASSCRTR